MHYLKSIARTRRTALIALCCALLFAAGCSERRSEQLRNEGDIRFEQGLIEEARAAYQRSEEANPENPMAQVGLGRCAAAGGEIDEALKLFEKARTLKPVPDEGYTEPVRLLVEASRLEEALALAAVYSEVAPEKGGLLHSAVLMKADRAGEAITQLEALRKQFPESAQVQLNLGVAYAEGGKPAEAEVELKQLVESGSPIASSAHMALIEVYHVQGKIKELMEQFKALADAKPEDNNIQLGYARVLLLADRAADAESIARKVLEKDSSSGWANYIVGAVKLGQGSRDEALAFLDDAATALPDQKEIARLLAQAKGGEAPAAPAAPEAATEALPDLLASPVETGTWEGLWKQAALKRLLADRDSILAEGGDLARETLVLSALFTQDINLAREIATGLPEDSKVRQFMQVMESRDAKTITDFFGAWNPAEPELQVMRDNALGFALASGGARGQALSLFLFCLERWPDNTVALFNIAQVFRALRQPVMAAQQLQRLIVQYPENIDAHQMLYTCLREGGAYAPARKAAEASYTLFPDEKWSFLYLAQAYLDTGDAALALQVLTRANGMFADDPELQLAMGGIYARLGDCEQGKQVLDGITSTAPSIIANRANLMALCAAQSDAWDDVRSAAEASDPAYWPESLHVLSALAHLKAGDADAARTALKVPGSEAPVAGKLGLMLTSALGVAVEGLNEEEQAWSATLGADQDLLEAYCTATALQMARLFDASWKYYETHLAGRTPHIAIARLGFAALQFSDSVEGVEEKALAVAEAVKDDPRAWLGLAEFRKSQGDAAGESEAIQKAVDSGSGSPEVWYRHAALLEKQQDYQGAVESYRKLLALQPDSAAANNNLAYMLLLAGGHDQEALEKAVIAGEKLPGNPGILHTLGLAQMRLGDLEASRKALMQASELDPANPTISFDYGRVLLQLGDKEKAKERVRYALGMSERAGLDFPQRAEAETLLGEME